MRLTPSMPLRLILAAAITAVFTAAASAQMMSPFNAPAKRPLTKEEIEKQKATDKAYKAAVDKIPEKKAGAADPWGNIRSAPPTASRGQ